MLSKIYKAYDIRGVYPDPLDEKAAWRIGLATGKHLRSKPPGLNGNDPMSRHVVVGRDMRPSSPSLCEALIAGLRSAGMSVFDVGMVDTPFVYFAINHLGCGGGVMVTASHNPIEYNGFKISGPRATPIGAETGLTDIQQIDATIEGPRPVPTGLCEGRDLWEAYAEHVLKFLELKRELTVVVDGSNGMACEFVPRIFEAVRGLRIIPLNLKITGAFSHDPNPLVPENMAPTCEAVREHGAELGVCFDGDADRCILCDERGEIIGCDLLGALIAERFLARSPGACVVHDLRASKALMERVLTLGGRPVRSRVGHVFMKKLMREHDAVFGAELSGHMYYRDNYYTDSGAITFATALSILSESTAPMSERLRPFQRYVQSGELNFKVKDKDAVLRELKSGYAGPGMDELDGVTIDRFESEGWWVNVRASNTEPLLRMNLEGRDRATMEAKSRMLTSILGEPIRGH